MTRRPLYRGLAYAGRLFGGLLFAAGGGGGGSVGGRWVCRDPGWRWVLIPDTEPEALRKPAAASRVYAAEFALYRELRPAAGANGGGEALAGTPTVTASPPGLTAGAPSVSGTAVRFRLSGGTAGTTYAITVTAPTDGGNTLSGEVRLAVV